MRDNVERARRGAATKAVQKEADEERMAQELMAAIRGTWREPRNKARVAAIATALYPCATRAQRIRVVHAAIARLTPVSPFIGDQPAP